MQLQETLFLSKQAFMEMHQWDSAAAMLERFMTKPPTIKGFSIQVQRSNYVDLQLKSDVSMMCENILKIQYISLCSVIYNYMTLFPPIVFFVEKCFLIIKGRFKFDCV